MVAVGLLTLVPPTSSSGGSTPTSTRAAAAATDRFALVRGCYALRSLSGGQFVAKSGTGYRASAGVAAAGEPFRAQATALGTYLFYGRNRDFLAAGSGVAESVPKASSAAEWRVDQAGGNGFRIVSTSTGKALAVGAGGVVVLVDAASGGRFSFVPVGGCPFYPEAEVRAEGSPFRSSSPMAEVKGTLESHNHTTSYSWFGGDWLCGRPWHPFGVEFALPDCASIQGPMRSAAPSQNFLDYGTPVAPRETAGWPTFPEWPSPHHLAEEMNYYTGIERAWRGGLRLMVSHTTGNEVFCEVLGNKPPRNPCVDSSDTRIQTGDLHRLQDYIDAQSGGPGKGWFRIVGDPFEARRVIAQGKLAVVPGVELSRVLGCGELNGAPECDRAQIDRGLDELHRMGIRSLFPIHKFDNAFGGTKMDGGEIGYIINAANFRKNGHFWDVKTCSGPNHDREQISTPTAALVELFAGPFSELGPVGAVPSYGPPPHCNQRGLTSLGRYLLQRLMDKRFIIEVDHMSTRTADAALSVIESRRYSGVVSSHSWDSPEDSRRIYRLGGLVSAITTSAKEFVEEWRMNKRLSDRRFYSGAGFGHGADVNGLHHSPGPSGATPIRYPFKSFDGKVTFDRERWGQRVFDLNTDGVSNYGMLPDWIEHLRVVGGRAVVADMFKGAEAYLQVWERAQGVRTRRCLPPRSRFRPNGVGRIRMGTHFERLLFGAGQPEQRVGYRFRYCVSGRSNRRRKVLVAFTNNGRVGLVLSNAGRHRAFGIGTGARARVMRQRLRPRHFTPHTFVRRFRGRRFVYVVRRGRVRYVGVASRDVTLKKKRLGRYLRRAGL